MKFTATGIREVRFALTADELDLVERCSCGHSDWTCAEASGPGGFVSRWRGIDWNEDRTVTVSARDGELAVLEEILSSRPFGERPEDVPRRDRLLACVRVARSWSDRESKRWWRDLWFEP